jgi:flagellar hook-associated protein 1 FlgK
MLSGFEVTSNSGRFKGFADDFANVQATRTALDNLANELRDHVNAQHQAGYDLSGNAGGLFFSLGVGAADLEVAATVAADPRLIAASSTDGGALGPVVGNGLNALAIAGIRDQSLLPAGTLNDSFSQLVLNLGSKASEANMRYADYETATRVVKEQRAAISGVNMDEEVANMLAFQRAYQGAARVITTVDDMLDRIINRMGRVGL